MKMYSAKDKKSKVKPDSTMESGFLAFPRGFEPPACRLGDREHLSFIFPSRLKKAR